MRKRFCAKLRRLTGQNRVCRTYYLGTPGRVAPATHGNIWATHDVDMQDEPRPSGREEHGDVRMLRLTVESKEIVGMPRKKSGDAAARRPVTPRKASAGQGRTRRSGTSTHAGPAVTPSTMPCTEDQVRERAYYIFLERQDGRGNPVEDWFQAERELNGGVSSTSG